MAPLLTPVGPSARSASSSSIVSRSSYESSRARRRRQIVARPAVSLSLSLSLSFPFSQKIRNQQNEIPFNQRISSCLIRFGDLPRATWADKRRGTFFDLNATFYWKSTAIFEVIVTSYKKYSKVFPKTYILQMGTALWKS